MAIDGRSARPNNARNPGPYEAVVISQLDPKYMGSLEVELLKNVSSGNQTERSGQIVQVKYMSPFYGVTPLSGVSNNDDFKSTQQSYGMWFVPPDVGTRVLVIFAEGNFSRGYWIGCVQDTYMNFMVPDPWAGSEVNNFDPDRPLPVGEYNKTAQGTSGNNPTRYTKPYNPDFYAALAQQGLVDDPVRGPTTSSARREVPSSVFGISTPGPQDKREGAPRAFTGPSGSRANTFTSRLGGSSLVFDDGDDKLLRKGPAENTPYEYADITQNQTDGNVAIPANECVRLRTRTGHQLLMHNSEDLIYIGNSSGSTWIEMTSNGKIDIFADDSISIRTSVDVNISSDRDLNFTAARDINFNSGRDYKLTVGNNFDTKVGVDARFDVKANYDQYVGATQKIYVGADNNLIVRDAHNITNQSTFDISTDGSRKDTQANFDISTSGYNHLTSGKNTEIHADEDIIQTGEEIHLNGPEAVTAEQADNAEQAESAASALWPARVPEYERWLGHEHLEPQTFYPDGTQARANPAPALRTTTPLISSASDEEGSANTNTDVRSTANQKGPQEVVPGEVGPIGDQPANPVPVTDLQRYFLSKLIEIVGLNPLTCLKSANPADLAEGEIPGNAQALGMAMAQIEAECGFKPRSENLNYSAERLRAVFPSRVQSTSFAKELSAAGPGAIGNTLYGGRFGNAANEGYKYRGRGLIQLTFKSNYQQYGKLSGHPEIVANPDLVNDPEIAVSIAAAYLNSKSISWDNFVYPALGQEFKSAVGYADRGGAETSKRIGLGKGFASKLITGELTPLAQITTEPAGTGYIAGAANSGNVG